MTDLLQAFNNVSQTANGDLAFKSTLNANLDFFYQAGASRGKDISSLFKRALRENSDLAVRTLLWLRDAREGAGERQQFKNLVLSLNTDLTLRVMRLIPEIGRWDDLLVFLNTAYEREAIGLIANGLLDGNGLCAKWMPRNGKQANRIRHVLGVTPKSWRKLLVELTDVVETKMCAGQWNDIEFGKVPSVAAGRYQMAFQKHAGARYSAYKDRLVSGTDKVNAGAVYPYDVIKSLKNGDVSVSTAQWNSLPDFMEGSSERLLPIVDVSGSMGTNVPGNKNLTCMDVAVSLGLYVAQRNPGVFQNVVLTFQEKPSMVRVSDDFSIALSELYRLPWGGSTDLELAFHQILTHAQLHNVSPEQMPTKILIISDMQFNYACRGSNTFDAIKNLYAKSNYQMPQIVFWNVNSSSETVPVSPNEKYVALVSGFSPSILKSVLKGNLDPVQVMLDTILKDRYSY